MHIITHAAELKSSKKVNFACDLKNNLACAERKLIEKGSSDSSALKNISRITNRRSISYKESKIYFT